LTKTVAGLPHSIPAQLLLDNFYMSNITPLFELVHIGPQNVLATKSEKVA
jgi:hypothetical protein